MGSIARSNMADRFIAEFNADACKRWDMSDFPCVTHQGLGFDGNYEVVRMYYTLKNRDREEELCDPMVVYDPEQWDDEEVITITAGFFDIEEDEARRRLEKAQLVEVEK